MLDRSRHRKQLESLLSRHPVVAILGARQVGKTTLALQIMERSGGPTHHFDLENPEDLARLDEPMLALEHLEGLVVIDEVQRRPDLFPILRVLVDRLDRKTRFLILGSASPELLKQTSESLAGRIIYHELPPFSLDEVGREKADELWLRGGFPRSFLADSTAASAEWRRAFILTFLERDIPQLGIQTPSATLHRFWRMLAHYHAQLWNGAELSRAFGVSATSVRRYLDLLIGTLVVRQLMPWYENLGKRQVKSPKVFISDQGILHSLLGIESHDDLLGHPKVGASWEGFVLEELVTRIGARPEECFFWRVHDGAEIDLLVVRGQRKLGFVIKRTTAPSVTRSMHTARDALGLESLDIIHAGRETFPLRNGIRAVAFERAGEDIAEL